MHDPAGVRSLEAFCDLRGVVDRLPTRQGAGTDRVAQGVAVEQLHDGVGDAPIRPEIVYRQDVGMRQRSDGVRLALEARDPIRIGRKRRGEDLDGDLPPQLRVAGAIHLAHPACAERRQDLVPADKGARHKAHRYADCSVNDRTAANRSWSATRSFRCTDQ